jgi:ComF family protein
MKLIKFLNDFINLLYPLQCELCDISLNTFEKSICTKCLFELPRTNYHLDTDNEVARMFWGRVDIEHATAWYYFQKGGSVQKLLHRFKYHNRKNIGYDLGCLIGQALGNTVFNDIDVIIPVPLHKKQFKKRGFNQSEILANGLSKGLNKPVDKTILFRTLSNSSQTNKRRYERWKNVKGIFCLKRSETIKNKHVLLVDDVITTGATIEACVETLKKGNNVKISVFALAKA